MCFDFLLLKVFCFLFFEWILKAKYNSNCLNHQKSSRFLVYIDDNVNNYIGIHREIRTAASIYFNAIYLRFAPHSPSKVATCRCWSTYYFWFILLLQYSFRFSISYFYDLDIFDFVFISFLLVSISSDFIYLFYSIRLNR